MLLKEVCKEKNPTPRKHNSSDLTDRAVNPVLHSVKRDHMNMVLFSNREKEEKAADPHTSESNIATYDKAGINKKASAEHM